MVFNEIGARQQVRGDSFTVETSDLESNKHSWLSFPLGPWTATFGPSHAPNSFSHS